MTLIIVSPSQAKEFTKGLQFCFQGMKGLRLTKDMKLTLFDGIYIVYIHEQPSLSLILLDLTSLVLCLCQRMKCSSLVLTRSRLLAAPSRITQSLLCSKCRRSIWTISPILIWTNQRYFICFLCFIFSTTQTHTYHPDFLSTLFTNYRLPQFRLYISPTHFPSPHTQSFLLYLPIIMANT